MLRLNVTGATDAQRRLSLPVYFRQEDSEWKITKIPNTPVYARVASDITNPQDEYHFNARPVETDKPKDISAPIDGLSIKLIEPTFPRYKFQEMLDSRIRSTGPNEIISFQSHRFYTSNQGYVLRILDPEKVEPFLNQLSNNPEEAAVKQVLLQLIENRKSEVTILQFVRIDNISLCRYQVPGEEPREIIQLFTSDSVYEFVENYPDLPIYSLWDQCTNQHSKFTWDAAAQKQLSNNRNL